MTGYGELAFGLLIVYMIGQQRAVVGSSDLFPVTLLHKLATYCL